MIQSAIKRAFLSIGLVKPTLWDHLNASVSLQENNITGRTAACRHMEVADCDLIPICMTTISHVDCSYISEISYEISCIKKHIRRWNFIPDPAVHSGVQHFRLTLSLLRAVTHAD